MQTLYKELRIVQCLSLIKLHVMVEVCATSEGDVYMIPWARLYQLLHANDEHFDWNNAPQLLHFIYTQRKREGAN